MTPPLDAYLKRLEKLERKANTNAEFIAESRSALPKLVLALRAAVGALESYKKSFIEDGDLLIDAKWINDNELSGTTLADPGELAEVTLVTIDGILKENK